VGHLLKIWARAICHRALIILVAAVLVTAFAAAQVMKIKISTNIEALMPEGAKSVQVLQNALQKTGSYASIQVVVKTDAPRKSLDVIRDIKLLIDGTDWAASSQYFEDIRVLDEHKLLLLDTEELLKLETEVKEALPTYMAKNLAEEFGADVTINIRDENQHGDSRNELHSERIEKLRDAVSGEKQTRRFFVSDDELTAVLIAWPGPGFESLAASKRMVEETRAIVDRVIAQRADRNVRAGVAGRIAGQVGQFDAIINDLRLGLLTAVVLISALIIWSYRTWLAIPVIFIPLFSSIIWTMGLTSMTIGNLNLITVFLTLILFGLGIDFGIHNFSRYREERSRGVSVEEAIHTILHHTGSASFVAATTTATSFFALLLTEFRAFTEFGFIAGAGIIFAFLSMYVVQPTLLVLAENLGWKAGDSRRIQSIRTGGTQFPDPLRYKKVTLIATGFALFFALVYAPRIPFEENINNLEARKTPEFIEAKAAVREVLGSSNSRAIVVVDTYEEVAAIEDYFKVKMAGDTQTPTIRKVDSIVDFVPETQEQRLRLEVIGRLKKRADDLRALDPVRYEASKPYLTAGELSILDLPPVLRRTYLGTDGSPGYLVYIDNAVGTSNRTLARQFYDDAAKFEVDGKTYYSASQDFIFVEMLKLLKADAFKAVILVTLTTAFVVFVFLRNFFDTLIVLTSPLVGVFVTVGIMGFVGPPLSIMNMVILPSLIGISVDNGIHIFHRAVSEGRTESINRIMNTTGRAAVLTTLTTLIGFGGMITASMGGLQSMAALAIMGFLACLTTTWFVLPILLDFYRKNIMNPPLIGDAFSLKQKKTS